jgi:hypothetical protein
MGLIPATGSEIAMGRVYRAFGLSAGYPPAANTNIGLNSTPSGGGTSIGQNRNLATGATNVTVGAQTPLSITFGGLTTPQNYP